MVLGMKPKALNFQAIPLSLRHISTLLCPFFKVASPVTVWWIILPCKLFDNFALRFEFHFSGFEIYLIFFKLQKVSEIVLSNFLQETTFAAIMYRFRSCYFSAIFSQSIITNAVTFYFLSVEYMQSFHCLPPFLPTYLWLCLFGIFLQFSWLLSYLSLETLAKFLFCKLFFISKLS